MIEKIKEGILYFLQFDSEFLLKDILNYLIYNGIEIDSELLEKILIDLELNELIEIEEKDFTYYSLQSLGDVYLNLIKNKKEMYKFWKVPLLD